jgi:hypothetical protein
MIKDAQEVGKIQDDNLGLSAAFNALTIRLP